jgi:deazaflavin-dependent oxidoreductase (nitroreductase family)
MACSIVDAREGMSGVSAKVVDNCHMTDLQNLKRRIVHTAQRLVVNPLGRRMPLTMPETIGRKTGQPGRTAIGGRLIDNQFWMVSEHGERSDYVVYIKANPAVRLRIHGQWRSGTAHLLHEDDAKERLRRLPGPNSALVRSWVVTC